MKNFKSFIVESRSELWHMTSFKNAVEIITTNSFKTSTPDLMSGEGSLMHPYKHYISFSRIPDNAYAVSSFDGMGFDRDRFSADLVLLRFDGSKLTANYKFRSVDWNSLERDPEYSRGNQTNDAEERLLTNKTEITLRPNTITGVWIFGSLNTEELKRITNSGITVKISEKGKNIRELMKSAKKVSNNEEL